MCGRDRSGVQNPVQVQLRRDVSIGDLQLGNDLRDHAFHAVRDRIGGFFCGRVGGTEAGLDRRRAVR